MPPRTPTDRSLQLEPHPGHDCAQCWGPLIPTALRWRCSECGAYDGYAVFSQPYSPDFNDHAQDVSSVT